MENFDIKIIIDSYIIPWGLNITLALVIFIIGKLVINLLSGLLVRILKRSKLDNILIDFISSIIKTILLLFVIIAAMDQLGINTTSLVALLGAAGLAIGLALQSSLQNFASGVMLIIFRPFTSGDFIEAAGISGTVEKINIFSTTMKTGDNREIIVPNGAIYGGVITNYSARETRRIDMVIGISYDSNIKSARDILQGIIDADDRILTDPVPLIAVAELADSSVNFAVRPWVKSGDYWAVKFDLNEKIKITFDEKGISLPYPQMDVHVNQS
ncbi:MAG: mechanosensitive ion channel [Gammaproteobacteria bacterium]|nr:mechanosensitive ion channel [Gammaproteobacteria bacterium]